MTRYGHLRQRGNKNMPGISQYERYKDSVDFFSKDQKFAKLPSNQSRFFFKVLEKLTQASSEKDWEVGIPQIEMPIVDDDTIGPGAFLIIGGLIKGNKKEITWQSLSFSIAKLHDDGSKNILRRFHFDYQKEDKKLPEYHLQYGGKFCHESHLGSCMYDIENIDVPRLYYPPLDLVLLFDMIIRNFKTDLEPLKKETYWKNHVRKSQKAWWGRYWGELHTRSNDKSGQTVHEFLYDGVQT